MIWFIFGGIFLFAVLFLIVPLSRKQSSENGPATVWILLIFTVFLFGSLGVYSLNGRPDLAQTNVQQTPVLSPQQALSQSATPEHDNEMSIEQLVGGLEEKLKANPNNPQGWVLYARSLMTLKRYDDAFSAYERVLELTENNPNIIDELRSAREFASQQINGPEQSGDINRGPSQDDIRAASQMSESDRNAMIQGMVDGLSAKLEDDPSDPDQWIKLLRARSVLGQTQKAQEEISRMKRVFENDPKTITAILRSSGWEQ